MEFTTDYQHTYTWGGTPSLPPGLDNYPLAAHAEGPRAPTSDFASSDTIVDTSSPVVAPVQPDASAGQVFNPQASSSASVPNVTWEEFMMYWELYVPDSMKVQDNTVPQADAMVPAASTVEGPSTGGDGYFPTSMVLSNPPPSPDLDALADDLAASDFVEVNGDMGIEEFVTVEADDGFVNMSAVDGADGRDEIDELIADTIGDDVFVESTSPVIPELVDDDSSSSSDSSDFSDSDDDEDMDTDDEIVPAGTHLPAGAPVQLEAYVLHHGAMEYLYATRFYEAMGPLERARLVQMIHYAPYGSNTFPVTATSATVGYGSATAMPTSRRLFLVTQEQEVVLFNVVIEVTDLNLYTKQNVPRQHCELTGKPLRPIDNCAINSLLYRYNRSPDPFDFDVHNTFHYKAPTVSDEINTFQEFDQIYDFVSVSSDTALPVKWSIEELAIGDIIAVEFFVRRARYVGRDWMARCHLNRITRIAEAQE